MFLSDDIRAEIKSYSPQKLARFDSKKLYEKAVYVTPSGEIIKGTEGRKEERSQAARKGARTKQRRKEAGSDEKVTIALERLDDLIERIEAPAHSKTESSRGTETWRNKDAISAEKSSKETIRNLVNRKIAEEGRKNFAVRIMAGYPEMSNNLDIIEYGYYESEVHSACTKFCLLITDGFLTAEEIKELQGNEEANEFFDSVPEDWEDETDDWETQ